MRNNRVWGGLGLLVLVLGCSNGTPQQKTEFGTGTPRRGQVFIVTEGRENVRLALVQIGLFPEAAVVEHVAARRVAAETFRDSLRAPTASARAAMNEAMQNVQSPRQVWDRLVAKKEELTFRRDGFEENSAGYEANMAAIRAVITKQERYIQIAEETRVNAAACIERFRELEERSGYLESGAFYVADLGGAAATAESDANGDFVIRVPKNGQYVVAARTERKVGTKTESYAWLFRVPPATADDAPILLSNSTLTTSGSPLSLVTTPK